MDVDNSIPFPGTEPVENNQDQDPFADPQLVMAGILITCMRIYDVLMADLSDKNKEQFLKIYKLHAAGGLMTPLPYFNPEEIL